jgi:predicted amidohydrolase YtcJ
MKSLNNIIVFLFLVLVASCSSDSDKTSEGGENLILVNARVYTLDWNEPARDGTAAENAPVDAGGWHPDADAIVVSGNRISFVGNTIDALQLKNEASRVIDLAGATVIPGLVDSHTHVFELGMNLERVNLVDVRTEEEAVALVAERAKSVPKGEWILGAGWDEGAWANHYPDKVLLSEAVPDHPVFLASLHGFAGWANQKALDEAGLSSTTQVPIGGEMRLGADGQPNGLFLNRGVPLIRNAIPAASREMLVDQLLAGLNKMAEDGYVTVHDAGLGAEEMSVLQQLEAEDRLPIRVYAMLSLRDEELMREWIARGPDNDNDSFLVTRAVKAYYDGALGSRGARLLYDYSDMPGHRGVSGGDYGFNQALNADAMKKGFQIAIHAIGDAGNRESIDILESVFKSNPATRKNRHRIEHAQVMDPADLERVGQLGLIASMEPPHAVEDKTWAEERVGPERILGAYAWRTLREEGAQITFNSDNPGSDHSIFYGMHSAITRKDKNQQPEGGWYADQALTAEETVRAYTNWAAYASFRENETGILEKGRWADITVIDIDPFLLAEESPGDILLGRVLMTIVNGRIVFER